MTSVLLIEKDEPAVNLMEWELRSQRFSVVVAMNAEPVDVAALTPDVIVFNTHMPGDGKRLWVSTLRFLVPAVKVIDLASPGNESYDTGADAYLTQPYRMDRLISIITKLAADRGDQGSRVS